MSEGIYLAGVVLTIIAVASFQKGGIIGNLFGIVSCLGVIAFLIIELNENKNKKVNKNESLER